MAGFGGFEPPYAFYVGAGVPPPHFGYYAAAPPPPSDPAADEVRTVFLTGFPDDVKERELNNMLRFLPGYEASQMHFRNGQAQGFALFVSRALARQAVDAIQNLVFDAECVLRAEMAHKNMYLKEEAALAPPKRSRPSGGGGFDASPSYPGFAPQPQPPAPFGHPMPAAAAAAFGGMPPPPPPGGGPGPVPLQQVPGGGSGGGVVALAQLQQLQPRGYAPISNTKDNPPCNTLFIGNLGDSVSEAEMRALFSHQPGFQQLKLVRGPKGVTTFIEFLDIATARAVHDSQQGAILASSDRGGIRIQYSKNPFGRKRDAAGALLAGEGGGPPPPDGMQPMQQQQQQALPEPVQLMQGVQPGAAYGQQQQQQQQQQPGGGGG